MKRWRGTKEVINEEGEGSSSMKRGKEVNEEAGRLWRGMTRWRWKKVKALNSLIKVQKI